MYMYINLSRHTYLWQKFVYMCVPIRSYTTVIFQQRRVRMFFFCFFYMV